MTATVCRQCNADVELTRLGRVEGEDSGVHIAIEGLPALDCANGHKRFPTPEFPLKFIEQMMNADGLITAEPAVEKGLFRKHAHCPSCGKELPAEAGSTSSHQVELSLPDNEPVAVELALPTYRCPGCQQEVTLPKKSVERGVMQAVANAFRSANIPPG
jgi:uncharacterized protein with PIN domain